MLSSVVVRELAPDELSEVASLSLVARDESSLGTQLCVGELERIERHLGVYASFPGAHVLVAHLDGEVAGFSLIRMIEPGAFTDVPAIYLEAIYVSENARRRGVGQHLLQEVSQRAMATGATEIYALPLPGSRGVQRFLARLGFAPAAAHRVVSVQTLQRNLLSESKATARRSGGGKMLDDLIARRRKARTETNSGPLDLRAFQAAYAADHVEDSARVASGE